MAKKEENPLFIGITNGNELRRSMLECSKDILEFLKGHEKFKSAREEKIKMIYQLRNDIKGVSRLINSLKMSLPKVNDIVIKTPEITKIKRENKPRKIEEERPKERTEIERLEDELSDIENKLNSLS